MERWGYPTFLHKLPRLLCLENFSITSRGIVEVDGQAVKDFSLSQLLRTACVPFHKPDLPLVIEDLLRKANLQIFRNHKLRLRDPWRSAYRL